MADTPEPPVAEPDAAPAPPPRARRRTLRRLGLLALVAFGPLAAIGLLLATLHLLLPGERILRRLEPELSRRLGVEVRAESLDYRLHGELELVGLRIGPPPGYEADVLRVRRVRLRYSLASLWRKRLEIQRLSIEDPELEIETRAGVTNLSRLGGPAEPSPPPAPRAPGPLLPLDLALETVELRRGVFRASGEGPGLELSGLSLAVEGEGGRARLAASARLWSEVASGRPRLRVSSGSAEVTAEHALAVSATVAADTRLGLALERVGLDVGLGLLGVEVGGPLALPPIDLGARAGLDVDLAGDRARLSPLRVTAAGRPVLAARAELDGLYLGLAGLAGGGAIDGSALLSLLGRRGPGRLELELSRTSLELGRLVPYARAFAADLEAGGALVLGPVSFSGTPAELVRLRPRALRAAVGLERVFARLPSQGVAVGPSSGQVVADGDPRAYRAEGRVELGELRAPGLSARRAVVELSAHSEELKPPLAGAAAAVVTLAAEGLRASGLEVAAATARVGLAGEDLLVVDREGPPVVLSATISARGIAAGTATRSLTVPAARLTLTARPDRLIAAARRPVPVALDATVDAAALPGARLERARLALSGALDDPRRGVLDADLDLDLAVRRLVAGDLDLADLDLAVGLGLAGQPLRAADGPPLAELARAHLRLTAAKLATARHGGLSVAPRLELALNAEPRAGVVDLERLDARLEGLLALSAMGRARRAFSANPELELAVTLPSVDLARVFAAVPVGIAARLPLDRLAGRLAAELDLRGALADLTALDPVRPRVRIRGRLGLSDLALHAPAQGLDLSGGGLELQLGVDARRLWVTGRASVPRLDVGGLGLRGHGAELRLEGGRDGDRWSTSLSLDGQLGTSTVAARNPSLLVGLSLSHAIDGPVELKRMEVASETLGVRLAATGSLLRTVEAALRPELALRGSLDFERLRIVLPLVRTVLADPLALAALEPLHGSVAVDAALSAPGPDRLHLGGAVSLGDFGMSSSTFEVEGVSGRIPFDQLLGTPPPRELAEVPPAGLGDDWRRVFVARSGQLAGLSALASDLGPRLAQLAADLEVGAKVLVDPVDVVEFSPRAADYELLRPYAGDRGPRLTIDRARVGAEELRAISADVLYAAGVLRLDRFTMRIWDGDVFGDLALQLTRDGRPRFRLRSTVTRLNLEIPYARLTRNAPSDDLDSYRASGIVALRLDADGRGIDGHLDLQLGPAAMLRVLDLLDLMKGDQDTSSLSKIGLTAMIYGVSAVWGESLEGATFTIRQNLLNIRYKWVRPWFGFAGGVVPQFWLPVVRGLQSLLGLITAGEFQLSLKDLVTDVRHQSLGKLWEYPFWNELDRRLDGLRSRLAVP